MRRIACVQHTTSEVREGLPGRSADDYVKVDGKSSDQQRLSMGRGERK